MYGNLWIGRYLHLTIVNCLHLIKGTESNDSSFIHFFNHFLLHQIHQIYYPSNPFIPNINLITLILHQPLPNNTSLPLFKAIYCSCFNILSINITSSQQWRESTSRSKTTPRSWNSSVKPERSKKSQSNTLKPTTKATSRKKNPMLITSKTKISRMPSKISTSKKKLGSASQRKKRRKWISHRQWNHSQKERWPISQSKSRSHRSSWIAIRHWKKERFWSSTIPHTICCTGWMLNGHACPLILLRNHHHSMLLSLSL